MNEMILAGMKRRSLSKYDCLEILYSMKCLSRQEAKRQDA